MSERNILAMVSNLFEAEGNNMQELSENLYLLVWFLRGIWFCSRRGLPMSAFLYNPALLTAFNNRNVSVPKHTACKTRKWLSPFKIFAFAGKRVIKAGNRVKRHFPCNTAMTSPSPVR